MASLTLAQKTSIINALSLEKSRNYTRLELYLKELLSGRDVTFQVGNDLISVSSSEAWYIISDWGQSEAGNLPLGDRGSMHLRASKLLNYIQINLMGKTTEAAASYRLILEQANAPLLKTGESTKDPVGLVLQKAYDLRREQIKLLQNGLIGKLATGLEKTKFLKNIPDAPTRALVMQMIAASNLNFRSASDFTPERINQLLLHEPGYKQLNNAIHLAYSRSTQKDFVELETTINQTIATQYQGNETKYLSDMDNLRELSELSPSLSDVNWMVNHLAFASTPEEKAQLIASLRTTLVQSARTRSHQTGKALLRSALAKSGLPDTALASLLSLSPYLEEIEVKQRHLLLGADLRDHDPRLLSTSGIAASLGVDLTTPWLKAEDLNAVTKQITDKYGVNSLLEAVSKTNDPKELSEIKNLLGKTSDYTYYQASLSGNLLLAGQEALAKGRGNLAGIASPVTRLAGKVWAGYEKVDDVVNAPVRGLANWWANAQEKYPVLDPAGFAITKWTGFQTGIALRIHSWAINVSSTSWFSGFAGHVADFTEGFAKNDASWVGAGSFFFERKWGNVLDWAAKKAGHESWTVARASFWQGTIHAIEIGGNKLAAGLGSKLATTLAGLATSESGIGLILLGAQVGWEVLKFGLGKVKQFFTDSRFRDKVLNWLPVTLGAGLTAAAALPALVLGGIGALGTGLLAFMSAVLGSLVSIFTLAATWAFGILIAFGLLFFIFKPTTELDTNSGFGQLLTSIVCDQTGQTASDPTANTALCIAKVLSDCKINPLFGDALQTPAWKCAVAALLSPGVTSQLEASSHVNDNRDSRGHLQCVGLAAASAGPSFPQINACSYATQVPSGYRYVSGSSGMRAGDLFIMGASGCSANSVGHIGVVIEDKGAAFGCVDANYAVPGQVRGPGDCNFAKSQISGYLRKG